MKPSIKHNVAICILITIALLVGLTACVSGPAHKQAEAGDKAKAVVVKKTFKLSAALEQQFSQGIDAMVQQDYLRAINIFEAVAKKEPRASGPWVNIAIANRKLSQMEGANTAIEKALQINPENPYAMNQAGIIKRELGAFEEAETLYRSALSEYPNYSNAHLNLAILCDLYLQKIVCAKSHYQAYQEIENNDDKKIVAWLNDLSRREPN